MDLQCAASKTLLAMARARLIRKDESSFVISALAAIAPLVFDINEITLALRMGTDAGD